VKTLVLGLGNTLLTDDGVGIYAARELAERLGGAADVAEAEVAGLDLIERLSGYDRVFIIDAIELEGEEPGTVFRLRPDDLRTTPRLSSAHDIDLVTALALGIRLGFRMPSDVILFAVQAEDARTLREGCLPAVASAVPGLVAEIAAEITGAKAKRVSRSLGERRNRNA